MDASPLAPGDPGAVTIDWGLRIPLRDGVTLGATLYRPRASAAAAPTILTLTPYVADSFHAAGIYFATHGFPFLVVDCRGRGNSEGVFTPNLQEVDDGYDVVEWVAAQPFCNGKVAMAGGSYGGCNQWSAAKNGPPHLTTIVPRCAAYPGHDFPIRNNIGEQYSLQWLLYVSGNTLQANLFADQAFWSGLWRDRFVAGKPFSSLPFELGGRSTTLQQWIAHPEPDDHWDRFTPSPADYARMDLPVLSITGAYDDDQQGALAYYRQAMQHGSAPFRNRHYLIIGPWDHAGVGAPQVQVGGVTFGKASLLDMRALSIDWYRWTMADGPRPAFLHDRVAYYVAGTEAWRYASSLDAVTARIETLLLGSSGSETRLGRPGSLLPLPSAAGSASYSYDPRDVSNADLEASLPPFDPADTRMLEANDGKQLVYQSAPFDRDVEVSGFFRLDVWIAIDQPDTDLRARVYVVAPTGGSILLGVDTVRARYRTDWRAPTLIETPEPLHYRFERFPFISRMIRTGDVVRLVIDPFNSIHTQKNYNSGRPVSDESMDDARIVTVTLHHGGDLQSALHIPIAVAAEVPHR